jgi:hypothetical protein
VNGRRSWLLQPPRPAESAPDSSILRRGLSPLSRAPSARSPPRPPSHADRQNLRPIRQCCGGDCPLFPALPPRSPCPRFPAPAPTSPPEPEPPSRPGQIANTVRDLHFSRWGLSPLSVPSFRPLFPARPSLRRVPSLRRHSWPLPARVPPAPSPVARAPLPAVDEPPRTTIVLALSCERVHSFDGARLRNPPLLRLRQGRA